VRILEAYPWPGNVRELAGEIERLVLYGEENAYITPDNISQHIWPAGFHDKDAKHSPERLEELLEEYERRVITETLKRNHAMCAHQQALGLARANALQKVKRLAIDGADFLQEDNDGRLPICESKLQAGS